MISSVYNLEYEVTSFDWDVTLAYRHKTFNRKMKSTLMNGQAAQQSGENSFNFCEYIKRKKRPFEVFAF